MSHNSTLFQSEKSLMFILVGAQLVMLFNVKMVHKRPLGYLPTDEPLTFRNACRGAY